MKKKQFDINILLMILINIGCVLSLIIVIFPLLLVAKYDYPSADDWSYGAKAYKTLKAGGGFIQVLQAAFQSAKEAYFGWDGRFANDFLDSLQLGIWGEEYYSLTPWILIGMLIISELIFFRFIIYSAAKNRNNALLWLPIAVPMLIIQILFTPEPAYSFYWYTGGMNYTFMYGLSLILLVLFVKLGVQEPCAKRWRVLWMLTSCILSVFVGGSNFSTSLSTVLSIFMITVLFLFQRKHFFLRRTWPVSVTVAASLVICLISPGSIKGNSFRMTEMGNPLYAVWRSLIVSANNVLNWTFTASVLLMLFFIFPFVWRAVENSKISFRYPPVFSLLTFGLYASQATPNIYVSGNIGGWQNVAILYYSYMVWLVGNIFYWTGWVRKKRIACRQTVSKRMHSCVPLVIYCSMVSIALVSFIYVFDKRKTSSYRAYRDWRQGLAQQYAHEWESRLEILCNDSINEVEFMRLQYYPEVLFYIELQEDENDITYWVNNACAIYYDKEYVHIVEWTEEK